MSLMWIFVSGVVLTGNEYMFYLAAATFTSEKGDAPKPSVMTRSHATSVVIGDVGKQNKGVQGTTIDEIPAEEAVSSLLKRKHANIVAPSMLH